MTTTVNTPLPIAGWRRRSEYLDAHPELRRVLPSASSLNWLLRNPDHRQKLGRYLAKVGRDTMLHDEAAPVIAQILIKTEAA